MSDLFEVKSKEVNAAFHQKQQELEDREMKLKLNRVREDSRKQEQSMVGGKFLPRKSGKLDPRLPSGKIAGKFLVSRPFAHIP